MASWMVHLRIADKLLDRIPGLSPIEFIVGNVAPDSGIPNEDSSGFLPPTEITHFGTETRKADPDAFSVKYLSSAQWKSYTEQQSAFYLGYLTHLLTDALWSERIACPSFRKWIGGEPPYSGLLVPEIKADWYDLDFKYLRDHPGFRAFRVYLGAVGFRNTFMEEFSTDAFEDRRQYITDFYLQGKDNLDREYPYLKEAEMDRFVEDAVQMILLQLQDHFL